MNNEDDIVDLILSGQNIDDYLQNIDEDYNPNLSKQKSETKSDNKKQSSEENSEKSKNAVNNTPEQRKDNISNNEKNTSQKSNENDGNLSKNKKNQQEVATDVEVFPQFKNPLDFVKYLEIDRVSKDILKEMQNFLLENHRKKDNKYEVTEITSLLQINNEIAEIDINLMYTKKDLMIFYSKNGNLLLFS